MNKEIYLAGGCFWGMQEYFSRINGIEFTSVGYANGESDTTDYKHVASSKHAETIHIKYNVDKINLLEILEYYFRVIDPTILNRQGNDIGTQYRTGIYFVDVNDKNIINEFIILKQNEYDKKIVVEVEQLKNYVLAEEYHQDYLKKNPSGYCHIDVNKAYSPLVEKSLYKKPENLKGILSDIQYEVTQNSKTERPFENEYYNNYKKGIYVDIVTKEPLFLSSDKFDSGCGWPSFSKPINDEVIKYYEDTSHGMNRVEVKSRSGHSHLGHVFNDGPKDKGGLRYCINSAALKFISIEDMEKEGYSYLIKYVK